MAKFAALRVCASCEWVFKATPENPECPKCGFGSYGARWVYGGKAYRYQKTQEPWKNKKLFRYEMKLNREIDAAVPRKLTPLELLESKLQRERKQQ